MNFDEFKNVFKDAEILGEKLIIKSDVFKTLNFIKENYGFELLKDIKAVDLKELGIELIYHLYNIEDEETQAQDELPEEISIPKTDDIIVESSTTDLMDSVETEKIQVDAEQESLDDYLGKDPSIDDTLTAEKIDYLSETPINEVEVEESNQSNIPDDLKSEIKSVLSYMDQLLENLPEDKIAEFAQSEQFDTYKKLFKELGLA